MKYIERYAFWGHNEEWVQELYRLAGQKFKPIPEETIRVVKIAQDDPNRDEFYRICHQNCPTLPKPLIEEEYTEEEKNSAPLMFMRTTTRSGYPQPEKDYLEGVIFKRDEAHPYGSLYSAQIAPMRLKSSYKLGRRDIHMLFWVDILLISKRLKNLIEASGLTGCEIWPVIKNGKNEPFDDIFQLKITGILPPMAPETVQKHSIVRRGPIGWDANILKSRACYRRRDIENIPDFANTYEWFGSGDDIWPYNVCSQKAYQLFRQNGIKNIYYQIPIILDE